MQARLGHRRQVSLWLGKLENSKAVNLVVRYGACYTFNDRPVS